MADPTMDPADVDPSNADNAQATPALARPAPLAGLRHIADQYDAMLCDVWGVLHDGLNVHNGVVEALTEFNKERPVVLITNAPRPAGPVIDQLSYMGVPRSAYTDIVASGDVVRAALIARGFKNVYHIGPDRDLPLYEGTDMVVVDTAEEADVIVAAGLRDDRTETGADYRDELAPLARLGVPFFCANPDIVVERGGALIPCAGALAVEFETLGGTVEHYGKPHAPIYEAAMRLVSQTRPGASRILAVGDAFITDVAGAHRNGYHALFVTGGIHEDELGAPGAPDEAKVLAALESRGLGAQHYAPRLVW